MQTIGWGTNKTNRLEKFIGNVTLGGVSAFPAKDEKKRDRLAFWIIKEEGREIEFRHFLFLLLNEHSISSPYQCILLFFYMLK